MSDPIALISSAIITETELSALILSAKGFVEPGAPLFGRFSNGCCHIWIGLSSDELEIAIVDEGEDYLAKITRLLGGPPRTQVTVEISRTEGSERLALEFAILFSSTWPAIMDMLDGCAGFESRLLTRSDLLRRQSVGAGVRVCAADAPQAA